MESNLETSDPKDTRLSRFLGHPLTKLTEFLLALVGVYSLVVPSPAPELFFGEKSPRTKLVTPGEATALTVLFDGQRIEGSVIATRLVLWNNGTAPVYGTAQRKTVKIKFGSGARILEAKVTRYNRPELEATLTILGEGKSEVSVVWNLLEPNDAVEMQIIYAGEEQAPISIDGSVVGQRSIRFIQQWVASAGMNFFLVMGSLLGCVVAMVLWDILPKVHKARMAATETKKERLKVRFEAALVVIALFAMAGLVIWVIPRLLIGPRVPSW